MRGQNVEIGGLDIFTPMLPFLVVYTWYVDDQPESTIIYFWHDEDTGMIHQEHLVVAPLTFEEAVTKAQEEAPKQTLTESMSNTPDHPRSQ